MTYMAVCRSLALQESMALRGFARQGRYPKHRPVDYWREWERPNGPTADHSRPQHDRTS
jgi:hypothetical protein